MPDACCKPSGCESKAEVVNEVVENPEAGMCNDCN